MNWCFKSKEKRNMWSFEMNKIVYSFLNLSTNKFYYKIFRICKFFEISINFRLYVDLKCLKRKMENCSSEQNITSNKSSSSNMIHSWITIEKSIHEKMLFWILNFIKYWIWSYIDVESYYCWFRWLESFHIKRTTFFLAFFFLSQTSN